MKLKKSMCILLAALMLGGCSLSGQQSQDLPSESLPRIGFRIRRFCPGKQCFGTT